MGSLFIMLAISLGGRFWYCFHEERFRLGAKLLLCASHLVAAHYPLAPL